MLLKSIVLLAFLAASILPAAIVYWYALTRVEAARRGQRIALSMASMAQERAKAAEQQLAACRLQLLVTMRGDNEYAKWN